MSGFEATLRSAFDPPILGVARLSLDGRFEHVDDAVTSLLGYSPAELGSISIHELTSDPEVDAPLWELLRRGEISQYEVERRLHAKTGAVVEADLRFVRQEVRGEVYVVALIQDAAARRAASEFQDRMLSRASHALRSPLGAILAWASLLRDDPMGPERKQALDAIEGAVQTLVRMVDDIAAAARLRSGTLVIAPSDCDLAPAIESAVQRLQAAAREQGVSLELTLPFREIDAYADVHGVEQMVYNLVHNAIKFTPRDGGVAVSAIEEAESWSIEVRDTGRGIEERLLQRIRADRLRAFAPRERGESLGLGLLIAKALVERHGGNLEADSPGAGQGSTFRLRLPRRASSPLRRGATPPATGDAGDL